MAEQTTPLTPMDLGRYYMSRIALLVDADHFQELCRNVAYAIDPAQVAYRYARQYGIPDLLPPEEILRAGKLPSAVRPLEHQG